MDVKALRELPSVEELAASLNGVPRHLAIAAARKTIAKARKQVLAGGGLELSDLRPETARLALSMGQLSLRRVVNATGVVLHTNLGRAPLAPEATQAAVEIACGYSNLEYDLEGGGRSSRQAHVEDQLRELTGAEAAIAVNNNAAAVMLAVAAHASGREVIVGRGQLVEIGGSFRIPEILAAAGARLVEVGTTNRTRIADYEAAVGPESSVLLRVHQSNFRTVGFVEETPLVHLRRLASERRLTLIDDVGSGALASRSDEPGMSESIACGADLACASADKLLGGPQAGILLGREAAVERCCSHPLARAVRIDKLQIAALEATLRLHRDRGDEAIPALAMLKATATELDARAQRLADLIGEGARVGRASSRPGGGSLALVELEGPVCIVESGPHGADVLAARLRSASPPVVARIAKGAVVLDPRTMVDDEEIELSAIAAREALA